MSTINISLPKKLKSQADQLVEQGFYVSFSDLVRDSMRKLLSNKRYDLWFEEAKKELDEGKAIVLENEKEVEEYLKNLTDE